MKRILTTGLLAFVAGALTLAAPMHEPHSLVSLWKQYEQARLQDLPQTEAKILEQIKQEALEKHLATDFYDAATEYVNTVQRRDWKQRDALKSQLKKEVEAFDQPIVTFLWMEEWQNASSDKLWAYVQAHPDGFQGLTRPFHTGVSNYLGGTLTPFIGSDKEYVLWRLFRSRSYNNVEEDAIYQALLQEVKGRYPAEAALELNVLNRRFWKEYERQEQHAAYLALAQKYAGKAVSLYPRAYDLRLQLSDLNKQKAPESAYRELYEKAKALEKERKSYKGTEADIAGGCLDAKSLMENLESQDLEVYMDQDGIRVVFQNLSKAKLTLRRGDITVQTWDVANPKKSFYLCDTVKLALPKLPDGAYTLEGVNGKISDNVNYVQYTLSIASRTDSNGRSVYVTDYKTGEPLKQATLVLFKSGKEIGRSSMKLDGFTPLPEALEKAVGKTSYGTSLYIEAQSGDRKSYQVGLMRDFSPSRPNNMLRCNIYKDRGAYQPGDTVHYKAIVFNGDPAFGLNIVPDKEVEVRLLDSEGNVLDSQKDMTNGWGSISGSFPLPRGLRNGNFQLEVVGLARDYFRVDEFVLPSFDLRWDPLKDLYLSGDEIPLSGELISYSGHSLGGAQLQLQVNWYGETMEEQETIAEGNHFSFKFLARREGWYQAGLTVTDLTGETLSFQQSFYVGDHLNVRAEVQESADVNLFLIGDPEYRHWRMNAEDRDVVRSKEIRVTLLGMDASGRPVPIPVKYRLLKTDKTLITEGEAPSGETVTLSLPGSGIYILQTEVSAKRADGKEIKETNSQRIVCVLPGDKVVPKGVDYLFLAGETDISEGTPIQTALGSARPIWAVVTLYGKDRTVLESRQVQVKAGALQQLNFAYKADYPDAVRLQVFYFLDGNSRTFERQYRRVKDRYTLPLQFTRFTDKALPGTEYTVTLQTKMGVEALAAAWDKSLDAISVNNWPKVHLRDFSVDNVYVSVSCGRVGQEEEAVLYETRGALLSKKAGASPEMAPPMADNAVMEEAVSSQEAAGMDSSVDANVAVRSNFSPALTFQPHLLPSSDGTLSFSFRTSDKLSTYYVRVYAHDCQLHNASVEQEMVVSLPVKVSLLEPRFLYQGDVWEAAVSVSSATDEPVSGLMVLRATLNGETLSVQQLPVTVPAGENLSHRFLVPVSGTGDLVLKASFVADAFSDAVQLTVPVSAPSQALTEAHSAVLHAGEDREALLAELRSRFVNVPASQAILKDISVLDMVRDAIPSHVDPAGHDVLSLSEAWYIRQLASRLLPPSEAEGSGPVIPSEAEGSDDALFDKIFECQNLDCGFGWFPGMSSSPVITAIVLERFAKLRDRGFEVPDLSLVVEYLDGEQFGSSRPYWRGGLSDAQYLHVRALYAEVPFEVKTVTEADNKRMEDFRKWVKDYLAPSTKAGRGMEGQILPKARRVLTLRNLLNREGGMALAQAWGVKFGTRCVLDNSLKKDIASLVEYAVEHRDGGWYYPNAVMPWRGLLESEAYAHSLLCDLLWSCGNKVIPDGIRLWLMLQKETQKWDTEPAYIDAITSILDGSEAVLNTRVLALSASYEAPFKEVKAAGNGFTIERRFYKDEHQIMPGDTVQVGDKIVAKYLIWNAENRSFVQVVAGRPAALSPVEQLSGYIGGAFLRPWGSYYWTFSPQGYRNVKANRTEFYFDSYPEEKTELTEEFFVTQAGTFQAPVVTIESLYASHYRANDAWNGLFVAEP